MPKLKRLAIVMLAGVLACSGLASAQDGRLVSTPGEFNETLAPIAARANP